MHRKVAVFVLPAGAVLLLLALEGAAPVPAQTRSGSGPEDYRQYCAPCHGARGQGDGVLVPHLATLPSDLTALAARNGGVYPSARVFHLVEGRSPAKAHGAMPDWGQAFRESTDSGGEQGVRARIQAIVDHVGALQAPAAAGAAMALCVLANDAVAGSCTEVVPLPAGTAARDACGEVLACLDDASCTRAFCMASARREGWRLLSTRRAIVEP